MSFLSQVNGRKHLLFLGPLEVANLNVESVYYIVQIIQNYASKHKV
jgi:hypothetical protein